MTTQLHRELMTLAQRMREEGREDLCQWIMRHVAEEQRASKRRVREPKVPVMLTRTGQRAWVPKRLVEEAEEE